MMEEGKRKMSGAHMKNRSIARFKEPAHDTATQDGDSSTLDNIANFFFLPWGASRTLLS